MRKALITQYELNQADTVEQVPSAVSAKAANSEVVANNPISRIPPLLLEDSSPL